LLFFVVVFADELGWKPLHVMAYTRASIPTVLMPVGLEKSIGLISAAWASFLVIRAGSIVPTIKPIAHLWKGIVSMTIRTR
jgi:hypothetical protein